ncbi:LAME_0E10484g1_1 [Lachancea meyersii CBS 8951]|uniref:LAME_0E10484g1_1 n=1 Tax=Lachancea meyersii CBS 8951 TaxID=1266667 RepID=A0A1G4JK72_9SACH|nr:LAME_0E10484g1_1 [Lachancea meyersii CBS 8951]
MRIPFAEYIGQHVLVMDGGQGTDLEARGIAVDNPLWSTVAYLDRDEKQLKCVRDMYKSFIDAGSNTLTTVTYQSSFQSLRKYSNGKISSEADYFKFLDYILDFTENQCLTSDQYLIGSIGPYASFLLNGTEYSGDYGPEKVDFVDYYRPQVTHFASAARVDCIGFETVPQFCEFKALLSPEFANLCSSKPYYISITTDKDGNLRDGTSAEELCNFIENKARELPSNLVFLGINCIEFEYCSAILAILNNRLTKCRVRFKAAYPNSGEIYDGSSHSWLQNPDPSACQTWENLASELLEQNCRMIGGCCRTTSEHIGRIAAIVRGHA